MKYSEKKLPKIYEWAEQGLTDRQISINLGVDATTFAYWKRTKTNLRMLLEKAREPVIREVENALYKRALGYEYEERSVEKTGRRKVVKRTKKAVPPDVKAQIFYLTNRSPDKWRFSSKIEAVAKKDPDLPIDVTQLSDQQLALLSDTLRKAHEITD